MGKCINCPLLDSSEDCPAITKNVSRYCKLVDPQDSSYNPAYNAILISEATGKPVVKNEVKSTITTVKEKPSLLKRAISITNAAYKHLKSGMEVVSDEEQKRRLSICRACEWYDAENQVCNHCTCYLPIKTRWSTSHCPIFKWGAIPEPERLIDNSLGYTVQTNGDVPIKITPYGNNDCGC